MGGTAPGAGPAWWYYYDNNLVNQDGLAVDTQPIYAGQNLTDGTVTCNAAGQLSIELGSWSRQDRAETVKFSAMAKANCRLPGLLPASLPHSKELR